MLETARLLLNRKTLQLLDQEIIPYLLGKLERKLFKLLASRLGVGVDDRPGAFFSSDMVAQPESESGPPSGQPKRREKPGGGCVFSFSGEASLHLHPPPAPDPTESSYLFIRGVER